MKDKYMKRALITHILYLTAAIVICSPTLGTAACPGDATFERLKIDACGGSITLTGFGASIAGGDGNTNSGQYSTIAGGQLNAILADDEYGWDFIGGGYWNMIDDEVNTSVIGGGSVNKIWGEDYQCVIGGGGNNVISNDCNYCIIGGGTDNLIHDGSSHGAILSGQFNVLGPVENSVISGGSNNKIHVGQYNVIGGGAGNTNAANVAATIAGGSQNSIRELAGCAAICGGFGNYISTNSGDSTIAGGQENYILTNSTLCFIASGYANYIYPNCQGASILGGIYNTVSSNNAVVCGGYDNKAYGTNSFAAGAYANALHDGCFVWADSSVFASISTSAQNQFVVRAAGGLYLGNTSGTISIPTGHYLETSTGGYLTTGGTWVNSSDKNAKDNFKAVDNTEVLRKVSELPISSWSYKAENSSVRHIGPTAQDFYAAFELGQDDRHIGTIDEGGVALAAIQGLNQKLDEKDATVNDLKKQLLELQKELGSLRREIAAQKEAAGE